MKLHDERRHRPVTLVWLDANEALLLGAQGSVGDDASRPSFRRVGSEVPPHRRSTSHVRHDPRVRSGGGADPDDLIARRREHLLATYLREVAALVPPGDRVVALGPGTVHGRFAAELRADDLRHRRDRPVEDAPAGPLTERQLKARWRELSGAAPERQRPANAGDGR